MNTNQIINMIMRQVMRRLVNKGVNMGIDQASKLGGKKQQPAARSTIMATRLSRR